MTGAGQPNLTFRAADAGDLALLASLLGEAVAWQPDIPALDGAAVLVTPGLSHYLEGWPRRDDHGLVAVDRQEALGAAWWRSFAAGEPGHGYVADDVPELAIAVLAPWRGRGIGTALMEALIVEARTRGLRALSLIVHNENPARRLYERLGFVAVGTRGDTVTMLREVRR
jgi:ribosomal protein S18 acetylase RimI-like enzyme